MEENTPIRPDPQNYPPIQPDRPYAPPPYTSPAPPKPYSTGKREILFCALMLLIGLSMANFVFTGGLRLGFAVTAILSIGCSVWYLWGSGRKPDWYISSVLALCIVISAAFSYSNDSFVKAVLVCFLLVGVNLSLCLMAGQNRYHPGAAHSLLDAPRTLFAFGFGKIDSAVLGVRDFFRTGGEASRRTGAILAGLCIAVPVLAVMVPLLIFADAAFEGLMDLLPDFDLFRLVQTVVFGSFLFLALYTRGVALLREEKTAAAERHHKGLHLFTVNTVLVTVCVLYLVYLASQLAYLSGGFSGILPEGYSTAEYARRGFFEMAWLCAINLGLITFGVALSSRGQRCPLSTRLACLFIGLVTLFLVSASCAKMVFYIGSYGLTRMRVLTMAIIVFLALTTVLVSVWLFVPRLPYMRAVMLLALAIGAGVIWMDVDTQVARYNVNAYLSGRLETIDIAHLASLGDGALEYLVLLKDNAEDPEVVSRAWDRIQRWYVEESEDFRSWTYINSNAQQFVFTHPESQTEGADRNP